MRAPTLQSEIDIERLARRALAPPAWLEEAGVLLTTSPLLAEPAAS